MLSSSIWNSRITDEKVIKGEKYVGHLLGPIGVSLLTSVLNSYLNIYYTDVMDLSRRWGGLFLSLLPLVSKIICVFTSLKMGMLVDSCKSPQGKARPWILLSVPFQIIGMICLFFVPDSDPVMQTVWVFFFYLVYYAVGNTAYSTSHSLMVSLATRDETERRGLSRMSNAFGMVSGSVLVMIFPIFLLPWMGADMKRWQTVILIMTAVCAPLMLLEYFYTKERVTDETGNENDKLSFKESALRCFRSKMWVQIVIYYVLFNLVNQLFSVGVPYYCNWVLGTYNDGKTQPMFYALGNFPYMLGLFVTEPLCRKFGRKRVISTGLIIGAAGSAVCAAAPAFMPVVLIGQVIKTLGLIPANFLTSVLIADALDDVERVNGIRCDGFSASIFSISVTVISGIALFMFNLGLSGLGYIAPAAGIVSQPAAIKSFFVICVSVIPAIGHFLLGLLTGKMDMDNSTIQKKH
ncbi:MAG: MFS transporter [Oscillospiraceae bacterium]|nr:MFS transporter [Oscillospiraceae bacterium]